MWDVAKDSEQGVIEEFKGCLERLGVDQVDCLLLHWPGPPPPGTGSKPNTLSPAEHVAKRLAAWRGLEAIYAAGGAVSRKHALVDYKRALQACTTSTHYKHASQSMTEAANLAVLQRSIGVSNFTVAHLTALLPKCAVVPHVNQIECHTRCAQRALVDYCQSNSIAW